MPTGRNTPLSRKDEIECVTRWQTQHDEAARTRLIEANTGFVYNIARSFVIPNRAALDMEDLVSLGMMGLLTAIDKFDVTRGHKLISYAVWYIRQAITTGISNARFIRVPICQEKHINRFNRLCDAHEQQHGHRSSVTEVIENAEDPFNDHAVDAISINNARFVNGNMPVGEYNTTFFDVMPPVSHDSAPKPENDITPILTILHQLDGRRREIVIAYYGLGDDPPMPMSQVGKRYGISRERIRQILDQTMLMINHICTSRGICFQHLHTTP